MNSKLFFTIFFQGISIRFSIIIKFVIFFFLKWIGFGLGLIYLPAIVSVTCYFEKKRSFATGIAVCGSGVGTFIFAPLTEVLVNQFAWKGAMLIISALTLNCVIFGMLFRPLEAPRKKALYDAAAASSADPEAACALVSSGAANASPNNNHAGNHLTVSHPQLLQVPADGSPDAKRRFGGSQGYLTVQQDQQQQPINGSRSRLSSRVSLNSSRKSSTHDLANASGVMYKKDVLYSGSMLNIPEYRCPCSINPRLRTRDSFFFFFNCASFMQIGSEELLSFRSPHSGRD